MKKQDFVESPIRKYKMSFLLNEQDIQELSRTTIIPFVNRKFTRTSKNEKQYQQRHKQKEKMDSICRIGLRILIRNIEKMGIKMGGLAFIARIKQIQGAQIISSFFLMRNKENCRDALIQLKNVKGRDKLFSAMKQIYHIDVAFQIKRILNLSWAFRRIVQAYPVNYDRNKTIKKNRIKNPNQANLNPFSAQQSTLSPQLQNFQKPLQLKKILQDQKTMNNNTFYVISISQKKSNQYDFS